MAVRLGPRGEHASARRCGGCSSRTASTKAASQSVTALRIFCPSFSISQCFGFPICAFCIAPIQLRLGMNYDAGVK